jgi:hypothetical protein
MAALERHLTAKEVGKLWALSEDTIRTLFRGYPGVLRISKPARRGHRGYVSIRIPESVVQKRHADLHARA